MPSFLRNLVLLVIATVAMHAQSASVVGLRYADGKYEIVSFNSETGAPTLLVKNAFHDLYGGSFLTDPASGIGYVNTDTKQLFRYRLTTGKVLSSPSLGFGGPLALGTHGKIVGVRYVSDFSYDIVSINTQTGATHTLVENAFVDSWGGSFISDPTANIGYAITNTKKLLRYNLTTGEKLSSPDLSFGGPLALAPNGKLVGIRENNDHTCDILSINPINGAITPLILNAFSNYWGDTFSSNLDLGIGYVVTTANQLFQFDLVTGEVLASPSLNGSSIRFMAFAGVAEARPLPSLPKLVYAGRKTIITKKDAVVLTGKVTGLVNTISLRVRPSQLAKSKPATRNWGFRAHLKRGVNRIKIVATGPNGTSRPIKIVVIRK